MIYRLLGELEIGSDGELVDLPGGRTLTLLAALLINANQRMSKTALIRAGWDSDDVQEAQLHKRMNVIRAQLARIGRRDDLRTHSGYGYEMRIADADADTLTFRRLIRDAEVARIEHRIENETGCLRQALRLWRGAHPLSNVPGNALRGELDALKGRRKRAAIRLFDLELTAGNQETILDELSMIADAYPADRRLCEQLMLVQSRCGHPVEAAQAYQRHCAALAEESAQEPATHLRDLHFAIARDDETAISTAEATIAARAGISAERAVIRPRQLPRPVDLVGRDHLVAEVCWLLRRDRQSGVPVVVISGPSGIGKTALAVRAAHDSADRYPDGQLYLELHGSTDSPVSTSAALAQFLRALGMPRVPEATDERLALYRTLLADRRVLVVLDDAADGTQVSELTPANPGCAALVTARQRLPDISDAHHVASLEPLGPADATELFLRVVQDAGLTLADDLDGVARVVALCGGLPLALRIAGALRVRDHPQPTAELADRLARQGPEALVYRELSVARSIGAGLERLDPGTRRLFLGLGLLPLNVFGRWTAAALLDRTATDAATALSQLAARFLVEPVSPGTRYRFHDLTREYARHRGLAEYAGDRDAAVREVYRALLTLARRAHRHLYGGDFEVVHSPVRSWDAPDEVLAEVDQAPLDWFEKERTNIMAAVEHCARLGLADVCWDLAVSAHEFYTVRGYYDDWYATHTTALAACREAADRRGEGIVLACLNQPALIASQRASGGSAIADLERSVSLLAECQDQHGRAIALRTLASGLRRQGHLTRPLALLGEALEHYAASGDAVGRWQAERSIGQLLLDRGDHQRARRTLEEAQMLTASLGRPRLIAQTQYWLGHARLASGDIDGARASFGAVYDIYRDDTGLGHAYAVHGLGEAATRSGAFTAASRYLSEAAGLARDGEDVILEGRVLLSTAASHAAQRQAAGQATALEQAAEVFARCGAVYLETRALAALAQVMADRGDTTAARAAWARVEGLWTAAGIPLEDRIGATPSQR